MECQHVESGKCARCIDFRSKESIDKHLKDKPFSLFSVLFFDGNGDFRWPHSSTPIVIHGQR